MTRPFPSSFVTETMLDARFEPAPELADWARETFINAGSLTENPEHEHLQQADIGFLWTNVENTRRNRRILGQAQVMPPSGDKWAAGRSQYQILRWFGDMPDFLITLDAISCSEMDDTAFMALIEHELLHCAQGTDKFGSPAFSQQTGLPIWAMRAHDVEEFENVVARYGATSESLARMVRSVNQGPTIAAAKISMACGNCLRLVK